MKFSLQYGICLLALAGFCQGMAVFAEDRPPPHGHHGPQLTDDQKACLDKLIGKPGTGERPTHEKMDAAFKACGVEAPPAPPAPPQGNPAFDADKNSD